VSVTETAKWPFRAPAAMLTSPASVNLMAFPTRLSSTCVRRCSSPRPTGSDLSTDVVSVSFLVLSKRLGGHAHRLDHAFDRVLAHVQGEPTGFDLGNVQHGVNEAQEVFAVGADARERVEGFWSLRLVEPFLHQLGIAKYRSERGSQLVAHVGDELRLVLAGPVGRVAALHRVKTQVTSGLAPICRPR
jgi:hypothetical protein